MFQPTLSDDYVHIYSKDPAIDQDAKSYDHVKWMETGDAKYLPVKPGCEPVRFVVRHLRGRSKAALVDKMAIAQQVGVGAQGMVDAVTLALVEIKNGEFTDGTPFELVFEDDKQLRLRRVDDNTMNILYSVGDGDLVTELASRIVRETFGNPT